MSALLEGDQPLNVFVETRHRSASPTLVKPAMWAAVLAGTMQYVCRCVLQQALATMLGAILERKGT